MQILQLLHDAHLVLVRAQHALCDQAAVLGDRVRARVFRCNTQQRKKNMGEEGGDGCQVRLAHRGKTTHGWRRRRRCRYRWRTKVWRFARVRAGRRGVRRWELYAGARARARSCRRAALWSIYAVAGDERLRKARLARAGSGWRRVEKREKTSFCLEEQSQERAWERLGGLGVDASKMIHPLFSNTGIVLQRIVAFISIKKRPRAQRYSY